MARNTASRTIEQVVIGLAMLEEPVAWCTSCALELKDYEDKAVHHRDHEMEVRMVAEFPMLREPCPDEECTRNRGYIAWTGAPYRPEGDSGFIAHPECQGRTWRLVTTERALLEAGKPYGIKLEWVELGSDGPETWLATAWARHPRRRVFGQSSLLDDEMPDPRKAIALALEACGAGPAP